MKQPVSRSVYSLGGLRIVSEAPLFDTPQAAEGNLTEKNLLFHYGSVPDFLPGAIEIPEAKEAQFDGTNWLIRIPQVGKFLICESSSVTVEKIESATDRDISTFLQGTVFALLCFTRGIVPMHASAIDCNEGRVIFIGNSGAGKSTLAAALNKRGYQVISDDVCFLEKARNDLIRAWPGIQRIRLWSDAVHQFQYHEKDLTRELKGQNKFLVPIKEPENPTESRPLRRVYRLIASNDERTTICRVQGAKRIETLVPNVYRLRFAEYMGLKTRIFHFCAQIANSVGVYEFHRPMSAGTISASLDYLERHLHDSPRD